MKLFKRYRCQKCWHPSRYLWFWRPFSCHWIEKIENIGEHNETFVYCRGLLEEEPKLPEHLPCFGDDHSKCFKQDAIVLGSVRVDPYRNVIRSTLKGSTEPGSLQ